MAIKTGVGDPIKIGNYGNLTLSDDKTAPLVLVYGGIIVNGKRSGEYMYDYTGNFFNKTGKDYNLYVAYDAESTPGVASYTAVKNKLTQLGVNPQFTILYTFSGGWGPAKDILKNSGASTFEKIYIVDIWMGKEVSSGFYTDLVKNNSSKCEYYYTSGGAVNPTASLFLAKTASKSVRNSKGHMYTNEDAIASLMSTYKPPFSPPAPTTATQSGTQSGTQSTPGTQTNVDQNPPSPQITSSSDLGSKLIIKKKSGPGEITGITELPFEVIFGENFSRATFKDLQFTEPGEYVLTISTDSTLVESIEVKAKVDQGPVVISQEKQEDTTPPKNAEGTRPIIAQIDEPGKKLPPIVMPQDKIPGPGGQSTITDGLGFTPVIEYGGNFIKSEDIVNLKLYHDGIVPKMELVFKDSFNLMKEGAPQDQTNIQVFLNSTSPHIKSIHMVFRIDNFDKGEDRPGQKYTISGSLNIEDLYLVNNKSYTGTSFEVIRTICKELGLGFNSNITNTDDSMIWRNTNKTPEKFIVDIIKHSYISDESFMSGYIDFYYCFNYVDVNKEMKRNTSSDIIIDTSAWSKAEKKPDEQRLVPLKLINDQSQSSSSLFFSKYSTENLSTEVSKDEGFRKKVRYYDRTKKEFLEFLIDSQTSDGKKTVILKGARQDKKFFDKNIKTVFLGKIDTENTHKNYVYATVQNDLNLKTVSKMSMDMHLPNANFGLYKLMNVNVAVMNPAASPTEKQMNHRDSGDWLLSDITYNFDGRKMFQDLVLHRSEIGKTPEEMKDKPNEKKPEPKENNTNPDVPGSTASSITPKPNNEFSPGEVYIVQDENNKKFKITVQEILDNGTEIKGLLEEI